MLSKLVEYLQYGRRATHGRAGPEEGMILSKMMQAVVLKDPGSKDGLVLAQRPVPEPGPGEALVQLGAAALNHRDLYLFYGPMGKGMPPFIPGSDGAGTVSALGPGVSGWAVGDAVVINAALSCGACANCDAGEHSLCDRFGILGGPSNGTFAGYICVPAANLYPKPAHLDLTAAAALPLAMGTAWRAVVSRGRLAPGETVLIHGIGSGVALYALQIAVGMGCRAIVTSSSAAKLEQAAAMGAAAGIDYAREDVAERVRGLTGGRGADLVVDGVGKATLPVSLEAVARGGRIVHFGAHTGQETLLSNRTVFWKQVSLIGCTMNSRSDFAGAMRFVEQRRLEPAVSHRFPLERVEEAAGVLARGEQFGKVVLTINGA